MKYFAIILCVLIPGYGFSLEDKVVDMEGMENNIISELLKVRKKKTYSDMFKQNNLVKQELRKALKYDESFKYSFDSLGQYMGTMVAPDNAFRLFNWNFEKPDGSHLYFGIIMKYDSRRERYILTELLDKSAMYEDKEPEKKTLDNRKWFGCLYYKIIPIEKGNKTYYTLLGWDGNSKLSKKKIIEVMAFNGSKIKFGFPIFKQQDNQWFRRVIFEYSSSANMSLKEYTIRKDDKMIVFDHLSPSSGPVKGHREHYFPDGSFDSYRLENGKWIFKLDPDVRLDAVPKSDKTIKDKYYHKPEEAHPKK